MDSDDLTNLHFNAVLASKGREVNSLQVNAFAIDDGAADRLVYIEMLTRAVSIFNRYTANWRQNRRTTYTISTDIKLINADNPAERLAVKMKPKRKIVELHERDVHGWIDIGFSPIEFKYLLGGTATEPPPHFLQCMREQIEIPFLEKWIPQFWLAGQEAELIKPLLCYRMQAWRINHAKGQWQTILLGLMEGDEISWQC